VLHKKTLIAFAAAVALGCVPVATNALAAGHPGGTVGGGHAATGRTMAGPTRGGPATAGYTRGSPATAGYTRGGRATAGYVRGGRVARYGGVYTTGPIYNGPIYDSCSGYNPGYGYGYGYNNGCPGYGVPVIGGLIGGILGGYGPY
jgi:hypothetical protein